MSLTTRVLIGLVTGFLLGLALTSASASVVTGVLAVATPLGTVFVNLIRMTVLPLATGGSLAHFLALDYALKPVLAALGARDILDGVYATDAQLAPHESGGFVPDAVLVERLERALQPLEPLHVEARCRA